VLGCCGEAAELRSGVALLKSAGRSIYGHLGERKESVKRHLCERGRPGNDCGRHDKCGREETKTAKTEKQSNVSATQTRGRSVTLYETTTATPQGEDHRGGDNEDAGDDNASLPSFDCACTRVRDRMKLKQIR
jgi:hypothetical protein